MDNQQINQLNMYDTVEQVAGSGIYASSVLRTPSPKGEGKRKMIYWRGVKEARLMIYNIFTMKIPRQSALTKPSRLRIEMEGLSPLEVEK